MFLYDKKDRMDEEGDHWLRLIVRVSGSDPFAARDGVGPSRGGRVVHDHFDWISYQVGSQQRSSSARWHGGKKATAAGKYPANAGSPHGAGHGNTEQTSQEEEKARATPKKRKRRHIQEACAPAGTSPQLKTSAKIKQSGKKREAKKEPDDITWRRSKRMYFMIPTAASAGETTWNRLGRFACLKINKRKVVSDIGQIVESGY